MYHPSLFILGVYCLTSADYLSFSKIGCLSPKMFPPQTFRGPKYFVCQRNKSLVCFGPKHLTTHRSLPGRGGPGPPRPNGPGPAPRQPSWSDPRPPRSGRPGTDDPPAPRAQWGGRPGPPGPRRPTRPRRPGRPRPTSPVRPRGRSFTTESSLCRSFLSFRNESTAARVTYEKYGTNKKEGTNEKYVTNIS
jgi:hypothetical protein